MNVLNNEYLKRIYAFNNECFYNKTKPFDVCLMNPPYDKNMHLKFLEKSIKLADTVVSIQPVRWLQETLSRYNKNSQYNKYKNTISKHIKDLDILSYNYIYKTLNIQAPYLGIYVCDKDGGYDYDKLSSNRLIENIVQYIKENTILIDKDKKDGYRVRIPLIVAQLSRNLQLKDIVFKDGKYNGKWWYEYYQKNKYSKYTENISLSVKFETPNEAHNFIHSFDTDFVKYVESFLITDVNISEKKILWMGNAKHPRTGTIGYKDEWTNEDFYKYFNVDDDEIKNINKYIDDYLSYLTEWK